MNLYFIIKKIIIIINIEVFFIEIYKKFEYIDVFYFKTIKIIIKIL